MQRVWLWLLTGIAFSAVTGCGGSSSARITRYPDWEYERYQRIAVLPVEHDQPAAQPSAQAASTVLENRLAETGAFIVLSRSDMQALMAEQDFSRLADVADPSTAIPEGGLQAAEALVVAKIDTFDTLAERIEERTPEYARDRRGRIRRDRRGRKIVVGETVTEVFRHAALVGGFVRVIDARTGAVLYTYTPPPIEVARQRAGGPPAESPELLAEQAARDLATEFALRLAPVTVEVDLDDEMFLVASDYFDGQWDEIDELPRSADTFQVVVRGLPPEANRNEFWIGVSAKDGRQTLLREEFVWSRSIDQRGLVFTVPIAPLRETGAVEFEVKLYSRGNDEPLLERDLELILPEDVEWDEEEEFEEDRED